jgi:hypothetical protein
MWQVTGKNQSIELNTRSSVNFYQIYSNFLQRKIDSRIEKASLNVTAKPKMPQSQSKAVNVSKDQANTLIIKFLLALGVLSLLVFWLSLF